MPPVPKSFKRVRYKFFQFDFFQFDNQVACICLTHTKMNLPCKQNKFFLPSFACFFTPEFCFFHLLTLSRYHIWLAQKKPAESGRFQHCFNTTASSLSLVVIKTQPHIRPTLKLLPQLNTPCVPLTLYAAVYFKRLKSF